MEQESGQRRRNTDAPDADEVVERGFLPSAPARRMPQMWIYCRNRKGRVNAIMIKSCLANAVTSPLW